MYYLIGKTLKHSKSKDIHAMISDIQYEYLELDDLSLLGREFSGLNVTIPYKEGIIEYLDEVDELSKRIGAVNTVVNNGKLKGYNTDYYGFLELLKKHEIDVKGKKVLIIGTGGSSKTVTVVLNDLLVGSIEYSSRSGMRTESIKDEYDIIINATPVGMYPSTENVLDVSKFHLEAVIDLVYNPLRTRFLQSANCKSVNGLYMLVAQAVKAQELFLGISINKTDEVYNKLLKRMRNIVLIGMPMSGKTSIGKSIANKLDMEFIDTDHLIEEIDSIEELFKRNEFRQTESSVIDAIKFSQGSVISTGGGAILNEENVVNLRLNGCIVYLKRDLEYFKSMDATGRPLLEETGALERLFKERSRIYETYADMVLEEEMEAKILEYFNS